MARADTPSDAPLMAGPDVEFVSAAALFAFDENLRIREWNHGAETLTGVPKRAALGRRCWEVLRGRDEAGTLVCHRRCPAPRLARAGRAIPARTLVIPGEKPQAVCVETVVVRDSGALRFLHLLRPQDESERQTSANGATPRSSRLFRGRPVGWRPRDEPPSRTLDDVLAQIAPDRTWSDLLAWPPDVFAAASAALSDSSAYRLVVSPTSRSWPPAAARPGEAWRDEVRTVGRAWGATVASHRDGERLSHVDELLARAASTLESASDVLLADLADPRSWDVFVALVTLHAAADEASAGLLRPASDPPSFQTEAAKLLTTHGSLSSLAPDRARVLPKLRLPPTGLTVRSLSRHLYLDRSEVESRWHIRPARSRRLDERTLTLLLVPYPRRIEAVDVRPVPGPLPELDRSRSGFFTFEPHEPFDPGEIAALVRIAAGRAGRLDAVVMPETALDADDLPALRRWLNDEPVDYIIAGVRQKGPADGRLGANYAFVGSARVDGWSAEPQHKHHRWCLEREQISQYDFQLDPRRRWWEAIDVHRRTLTFASLCDWLTVCPLVCEDLARPDPVADVIRGVGPTLIVALLLDGPQLALRWPARYASVLAEDPGSAVLTLTALGMVERSRPPGMPASRVVALWKDPRLGLRELELEEGSRAIVLKATAVDSPGIAADGRQDDIPSVQLTFAAAEQIP